MTTRLFTTALAALLISTSLGAQTVAGSVAGSVATSERRLSVQVRDGADRPVAMASVELRDGRRRVHARTDSSGSTLFVGLTSDSAVISVRRVGFAPAQVVAHTADVGDRVTVFVEQQANLLSTVEVRDEAPTPTVARHADYETRLRLRSASANVTRAQIEQRNPVRLTQMLRGLSGLRIADSAGSMVAISTRGMKPVRVPGVGIGLVPCVMRIMVDGIVLPPLTDIDKIQPRDVHGVEVFFGAASIPSSLAGTRTDSWCGLVAIWTRSGDG